jgi:hypothetical protein
MQRIKLLLTLGGAALCAVPSSAQTGPAEKLERGLRPHPQDQRQFLAGPRDAGLRPEIRVFYINNVEYRARISDAALRSSPDWTPTKPLPLDLAKAERIARQELGKLVADASTWEVAGFHLRSTGLSVGNLDTLQVSRTLKWYFQVEMRPPADQRSEGGARRPDSFWVFIDLSGQAGEIQAQREP